MFQLFFCSLRGLVEEDKTEVDGFPFQRNLCVNGQVKDLSLTLGRCRVLCSFAVVGEKHDYMRYREFNQQKLTINRRLHTLLSMLIKNRLSSLLTDICLCFRQQQADDLTWQQDIDVPQGEWSISSLSNGVLIFEWFSENNDDFFVIFSVCCRSRATDAGVWDNHEGAGGLCQQASPWKVNFSADQLHSLNWIIWVNIFFCYLVLFCDVSFLGFFDHSLPVMLMLPFSMCSRTDLKQ